MDNIIKVWIVTIIITITALLLPTIIANADEERQPLDRFKHWHITNKDLGTGELDKHEIYYGYDGTDDQLKTFSVIAHSNKYGTSERPATVHYAVVYNDTDKSLVHAFNKNQSSTQTIESGGYIKGMVGSVIFDPVRIYSSNATYYIDFEDEKINIDEFIESIIGGVVPDGTQTLNPNDVWDDDLNKYVDPNANFDLETPKNVKITIPSDFNEGSYHLSWEQSEEFYSKDYASDVEIEIFEKYFGKARIDIVHEWHKFEIGYNWVPKEIPNKRCEYTLDYSRNSHLSNNRRYSVYQWLTEIEGSYITIFNVTEDTIPIEFYTNDYLIRNKYTDENGKVHYSNFVHIMCHNDGYYQLEELDGKTVEEIKKQDSIVLDDEDTTDIRIEGDYDPTQPIQTENITLGDTDIFQDIKGLFDNLLGFPNYFKKIFGFFPSWILKLITFGIGALITIGILKAIL